MTTSRIALLSAAIDAGDESALTTLADLLEEAGDGRAAGLRMVGDRRPASAPEGCTPSGNWWWEQRDRPSLPNHITPHESLRFSRRSTWAGDHCFTSRSAALLALAEALE